jgi:hypothetical protein
VALVGTGVLVLSLIQTDILNDNSTLNYAANGFGPLLIRHVDWFPCLPAN